MGFRWVVYGPALFLKERKKVAVGDIRQVAWLVNPLSANKPAEFKIKLLLIISTIRPQLEAVLMAPSNDWL